MEVLCSFKATNGANSIVAACDHGGAMQVYPVWEVNLSALIITCSKGKKIIHELWRELKLPLPPYPRLKIIVPLGGSMSPTELELEVDNVEYNSIYERIDVTTKEYDLSGPNDVETFGLLIQDPAWKETNSW